MDQATHKKIVSFIWGMAGGPADIERISRILLEFRGKLGVML